MTHRVCRKQADLRDYCPRRQKAGHSYRFAVTATATRLCHVTWRILTDRRDYLPRCPNGNC